ncbi:MAG: hypothetical protein AAFV45_08775 [Pseudomonadota bacterium]
MENVDVFVVPDDWQFYQAELGLRAGHITVAAEPHVSGSAVVTLDAMSIQHNGETQNATLFMSADEALEIWTALGHAIANASGEAPKPVKLVKTA